jgi:hypothetical protein
LFERLGVVGRVDRCCDGVRVGVHGPGRGYASRRTPACSWSAGRSPWGAVWIVLVRRAVPGRAVAHGELRRVVRGVV